MRSLSEFLCGIQIISQFSDGKKYTIHSRLSCDSKNVIYLASCKKCRLQYVGSTTTDFRIRFHNHKSAMLTNKTTCEVAVHLNKIPHTLGDFLFQCIDQVQTPNNSEDIDRLLITRGLLECSAVLFGTPRLK